MNEEEFELIGGDGLELFGRSWLPENSAPDAIICLVHGLSEHSGRYKAFAEFFTSNKIGIFTFDIRGHGQTKGKRGHAKYDLLLEDVENLLKEARKEFNETPLFLFGQSLGGNIVSSYLLRKNTSEVAGAILSAAWLKLAFEPPAFKVKLAGIVRHIFPSYLENSQINAAALIKDPAVIAAYNNDPLVHDKISASLFFGAVTSGESNIENAFKLTVPTLVIHGKADKLTSWQASEEFAKNAGKLAEIQLFDEQMHEPHNDFEKEEILNSMLGWIVRQIEVTTVI
ncbi:MAG: alpha/beta hydrolase [Cyclobacteriaceae bacterium]